MSAPSSDRGGLAHPAQEEFSQQQLDGYCSSAKSVIGPCLLTFYFGNTGSFHSTVKANCAVNVKY